MQNVDAALNAGFVRLQEGDVAGAERAVTDILAKNPSAKAFHLYGLVKWSQRNLGDAEHAFRLAARAAPNDPSHFVAIGSVLLEANAAARAVDAYREAVRLDPKLGPGRRGLARALEQAGLYIEAENAARAELAQERRPDMLKTLGVSLYGQRRFDEAIAIYDEALRLAPDDPEAMHNRAMALDRVDRAAEAIAVYDGLVRAGIATPDLYLNWAWALINRRQFADAEKILLRGAEEFPSNDQIQFKLAQLRWSEGESPETFARDLELALSRAPRDQTLRLLYAFLLERAERVQESEAVLREGLAFPQDDPRLYAQLGTLLDYQGRFAEAADMYKAGLARAPNDGQLLCDLARVHMRSGDGEGAFALAQPLLSTQPNNRLYIAYGAMAARMIGHPDYQRYFDYDRFVRATDLPAPAGFASIAAFNDALAASLRPLHHGARHPLNQSVREGTQTHRSLLDSNDPVIRAFFAMAREAVAAYIAALPRDATHPFLDRRSDNFIFDDAWSIRLQAGGHHVNHIHTRGWISAAYYVQVPDNLSDGHAGWIKFGEPRVPMPGCTPAHWIEPKAGRLALFPSYMWHGVEPFREGERLTISFDIAAA